MGWFPWQRAATPRPAPDTPPPRPADEPGWLRREEAIMATTIEVELWCEDPRHARHCAERVIEEMHRINRTMSPHLASSELALINREAAHRPVALSEEMFRLLSQARAWAERSDGAFDITFASAGQHYDYRAGHQPDDTTLARALAATGWQHLALDADRRSVRFLRPGMRIDLGGFAKGHAVDNAVAILRDEGIRHAMVAAGGDSHLLGDRRGRPWHIAIRDPRQPGQVVAVLPLQDVAISTSGDYERFFIAPDGQRHHHVLDPRTGRAARAVRSVTVLADDGLTTEALSKTVFVLGAQRGLALINQLPGVDAVVVDAQGRLHHSQGLLGPRH